MDVNVEVVINQMRNHFADTVNVLKQHKPPGTNAANGHLRNILSTGVFYNYWMIPVNGVYEDWRDDATKGEASVLQFAHSYLHWPIVHAFSTQDNFSANWTNPHVFLNHINIVADALKVISDIIAIIYGGDDSAKNAIGENIRTLINDVNNKGTVHNGAHLNGFIASMIHNESTQAVGIINERVNQVSGGVKDPDVIKMIEVIKSTLAALHTLPTHHPVWLSAEWQIKFQAIMEAALKSVEEYITQNQ